MTHRLRRLDGLRGIAILLVIFGHVGDFTLGVHQAGEIGAVGVLLFFILSGHLITGMLYREITESCRINLREFFIRRALRILPAFWLLIGVTILLMLIGLVTDVTWKAILACLLFARNIRGRGQSLGHIWSLSLQEQFYFVWPLIMAKFGLRRAMQVAIFLIVAGTCWRTFAIATQRYPYESDIFYLRTDFRLDSILVGCVIALAMQEERLGAQLARTFSAVPVAVPLLLLVVWSLTASISVTLRPAFLTVETVLACAAFTSFVVSDPRALVVRICEHRSTVWLGTMSYSLYLWQQLFVVTREPSWGALRQLPLNLVCIVAAAMLSHRFVEGPAIRWRQRHSRTAAPRPPIIAGA